MEDKKNVCEVEHTQDKDTTGCVIATALETKKVQPEPRIDEPLIVKPLSIARARKTSTPKRRSQGTPPSTPSPTKKTPPSRGSSKDNSPQLTSNESTPLMNPTKDTPSPRGGISRVTPSTSGRSSVSPSSGPNTSKCSSTVTSPSNSRTTTPPLKRIVRPGITWRVGARLEAMDYLKKWYVAKIVEICTEDNEVLIHFEGWNSRFDEWLEMTSERLRPLTRHSDRKDHRKDFKNAEHKVGDIIMARWTDCRLYPAKIIKIVTDGNSPLNSTYTVVFYDGFQKDVQKINVKPVPPEIKKQIKNQTFSPPSSAVTPTTSVTVEGKRPIKPAMRLDGTLIVEKRKLSGEGRENLKTGDKDIPKKITKPIRRGNRNSVKSIKNTEKQVIKKDEHAKDDTIDQVIEDVLEKQIQKNKKRESSENNEKKLIKSRKVDSKLCQKKQKLIIGGSFMSRKVKQERDELDVKQVKAANKPRPKKRPPSRNKDDLIVKKIKHETDDMGPEGLVEISPPVNTAPGIAGAPCVPFPGDRPHFTPGKPPCTAKPGLPTIILSRCNKGAEAKEGLPVTHNDPTKLSDLVQNNADNSSEVRDIPIPRKVKRVKSAVDRQHMMSSSKSRSASEGGAISDFKQAMKPRKAFMVEADHNRFKCHFKDCDKGFRKESLLRYHVKYYHNPDGSLVQIPPPRKRQKTFSMCSTDSEISVVSVGSHPSSVMSPVDVTGALSWNKTILGPVISKVPEATEHTITTEHVTAVVADTVAHDEATETGDEDDFEHMLRQDEVVNCICGMNEEDDLMIQCEVCLCWQHAACFGLTSNKLPQKYICYVCINPRSVRESCKYIYDLDWFKTGHLSRFNFLQDSDETSKSPTIKQTHELVENVQNLSTVLSALKQKIHVLRNEPENPEIKLWTENWDTREKTNTKQNDDTCHIHDDTSSHNTLINVSNESTDSAPDEAKERPEINTAIEHDTDNVKSDMYVRGVKDHEDRLHNGTADDSGQHTEVDIKNQDTTNSKSRDLSSGNFAAGCHDYKLSPVPSRVIFTGNSVWTPVCKNISDDSKQVQETTGRAVEDSQSTQSSSNGKTECAISSLSDTPNDIASADVLNDPMPSGSSEARRSDDIVIEDDLYSGCEQNLLDHIVGVQETVDKRLDLIEQQINSLEGQQTDDEPDDTSKDIVTLKKSLKTLMHDLTKAKRMARYH